MLDSQTIGAANPPVRDGHVAPATCAACGCRLTETGQGLVHYGGFSGRDAVGHRVECAELPHEIIH